MLNFVSIERCNIARCKIARCKIARCKITRCCNIERWKILRKGLFVCLTFQVGTRMKFIVFDNHFVKD